MEFKDRSVPEILVAASSQTMAHFIEEHLSQCNCRIHVELTGEKALDYIVENEPFCAVFDTRLEDADGEIICRILKDGYEKCATKLILFGLNRNDIFYATKSDGQIYESENEIPELVEMINSLLQEYCTEQKENEQTDDEVQKTKMHPSAKNCAFRAMKKEQLCYEIMNSIYEAGMFTIDLDEFSERLLKIAASVFGADCAVLILNTNPPQIYTFGFCTENNFFEEFINVCLSDFNREDKKLKSEDCIVRNLPSEDEYLQKRFELSSYRCIELNGNDFNGTIHLASNARGSFGNSMDSLIEFFVEKSVIFLEQALYYKRASFTEQRLRRAFSRFVPEEVIDRLTEDAASEAESINEKRKVAVLICDIRNFTSISERNKPENVVSFLNEYFKKMVEVIKKHGGAIDKFMGDAIMALFGTPVSYEDNARRAVDAALEMQSLVPGISCSNLFIPEGMNFNVGIGIHYGDVIVGSIGCAEKSDYTVIGDTVNLASRLEGLTKFYGAGIIISGAVKNELNRKYNLLHLDSVKVKGKSVGVQIYRVDENALNADYVQCYKKALELYTNGAWNLAASYFERAQQLLPADKSASKMYKRCLEFISNPPLNWDGAYSLNTK
ncbi:adenylate/guanylate cyclase domain-containing protein [Treponema sp.]|uniref:adenylate/guanylate cyclase domain-containing protein n=1 Tax=Treponema sp. TaxID=166 RepID=UPI003FD8ED8E